MLRIFLALCCTFTIFISAQAKDYSSYIQVKSKSSEYTEEATNILMNKCKDCHTMMTEYPFYYSIPGIKEMIDQDVNKGRAYLNMDQTIFNKNFDSDIDTVTLNRLKVVVEQDTMPPLPYKIMHWNSILGAADKEILLSWIDDLNTENFEPLPDPKTLGLDENKVNLGNALFHDGRLSRDNTISCASCHNLAMGGTDHQQFSTGINNSRGHINSPTVFNSSYNFKQFWDGRAEDLVAQAQGPVHNPLEMGSDWTDFLNKIKDDEKYKDLFEKAYGTEKITGEKLAESIATFEESLITYGSKFDQYLSGNDFALNEDEKEGFELFKKYNCNNCHTGISLGGTTFQKMGRYRDYFDDRAHGLNGLIKLKVTKADLGRYNVTNDEADKYKFKVPNLRHIKETYPYLHDGSILDLHRVVDIMGEYQVGKKLTKDEIDLIVQFLNTL
jgi:cytochrome c peroxidase